MSRREDWPQTFSYEQKSRFKPDRFAKGAGRQPWINRREKRIGNSNRLSGSTC